MKGKWRQILARFDLPERLLLAIKKIKYYFGLLFAAAGGLISFWGFLVLVGKPGTWFQPDKLVALSRIIAGAFAIGAGGHLALSASRPKRPISDTSLLSTILGTKFWSEALVKNRMWDTGFKKERKLNVSSVRIKTVQSPVNDNTANDRLTIHTGGGNYNESISGNYNEYIRDYIQGNSITIQGDCISMNSDLSEVAAQLLEIVTRLQDEGDSKQEAQQRVADDLANQAKSNGAVKVKLLDWKRSTGDINTGISLSEAAIAVVKAATETSLSVPSTAVVYATLASDTLHYDLALIKPVQCQELENCLKAGKWREADKATASIILKPLIDKVNGNEYLIREYIHSYIKSFPGEDLRFINTIWLKYSEGRFGFSIQKNIWKEVDEDYDAFGDSIGWRVDGKWIYYSDITYSRKAPLGHLPVSVMMVKSSSFYETCVVAKTVLKTFASRQYKVY
jgi:hypothetical protein